MRAPDDGAIETSPILRTASSAYHRKNSAAYATSLWESGSALPFSRVMSFARRSASRMTSSWALRRISARSRGRRAAQTERVLGRVDRGSSVLHRGARHGRNHVLGRGIENVEPRAIGGFA